MSDHLGRHELEHPERHPIHLVVTDDLERSRLTVFFRLFLALPHFLWLAIWGIGVFFVVIAAWFVALVMGRVPDALHTLPRGVRPLSDPRQRVLLHRREPVSELHRRPGVSASTSTSRLRRHQNRLTILVRLILAIPAFIVLYVLQLVGQVVGILAWFYALFTGNMNRGMRDLLAYWLRYQAQTYGYVMLLTGRYPSFSDE